MFSFYVLNILGETDMLGSNYWLSADAEKASRAKQIEKEMLALARTEQEKIKLLLLGAGESGKRSYKKHIFEFIPDFFSFSSFRKYYIQTNEINLWRGLH